MPRYAYDLTLHLCARTVYARLIPIHRNCETIEVCDQPRTTLYFSLSQPFIYTSSFLFLSVRSALTHTHNHNNIFSCYIFYYMIFSLFRVRGMASFCLSSLDFHQQSLCARPMVFSVPPPVNCIPFESASPQTARVCHFRQMCQYFRLWMNHVIRFARYSLNTLSEFSVKCTC